MYSERGCLDLDQVWQTSDYFIQDNISRVSMLSCHGLDAADAHVLRTLSTFKESGLTS